MKTTESKEMYLEVIYDIDQQGVEVRSVDIARVLGYSKPSVNRGINLLKNAELIMQEPYGCITLTDKGRQMAEQIKNKHVLLTEFLKQSLKIDDDIAEKDACRIEHVISEETVDAIKKYLGNI